MSDMAGRQETAGSHTRDVARRVLKHENAILGLVLIVLVAVVGVLSKGLSVRPANAVNILVQRVLRQ